MTAIAIAAFFGLIIILYIDAAVRSWVRRETCNDVEQPVPSDSPTVETKEHT